MRPICLSLLFLAICLVSEVRATTVLKVSLCEMARISDLIIHAKVVDIRIETDKNIDTKITTLIKLKVIRTLKGHATGPHLNLSLLGGSNERWVLHVPGSPIFRKDEEVILFLEKHDKGYTPVGLSLGKFSIYRDQNTGILRAKRDMSNINVLVRGETGMKLGSDTEDDITLEYLFDQVKKGLNKEVRK